MNLFDIVGPVMVGPSSSHTAGVVRIGNVVHKILGGVPDFVTVKFHGSFATTYQGHGSDKAIIAGVLGYTTDDPRIRNSFDFAKQAGMDFKFETIELKNAHPNTIVVEATSEKYGDVSLVGESVGGGNIIIRKINDTEMEFNGQYDTMLINHNDTKGMVAFVSKVLLEAQVNIATMIVYRAEKGGEAIMMIEVDGHLSNDLIGKFLANENIKRCNIISKI